MMNTNLKWHYANNMENVNSQPAAPPQQYQFMENKPVVPQPQHHHSQFQHYPQIPQVQGNFIIQNPPKVQGNFIIQNPPQQQQQQQFYILQPKMPDPPQNTFYQPRPQVINDQFVRHPQPMQFQEQIRHPQMHQPHFFQQQNRMPGPATVHYPPQMHPQQFQQHQQPPSFYQQPIIRAQISTPPRMIREPSIEIKTSNSPFENEQNAEDELDINHFLRLDFADDEPSRKRKMNEGYYESQAKRPKRRTRAEIIEDKNRELIARCKPLYVPLENMLVSNTVRIFGNCEYRHRSVRVHRMKLTPKNEEFNRVKNMGYVQTSNGTAYGCFIGECRFKTYKKERFCEHLTKFHVIEGAGSREGYCRMCDKNNCGYGLIDELLHMQSHHIDLPYEATHLILYSRLNNELIRKVKERKAKSRELKEQMSLQRTLAMFEELENKDNEEIHIPQETIDDGTDDDYKPESDNDSDAEIEEPDPESEEEDIDDSESVASSDMESEELDEDEQDIPLADTSSDEDRPRRKRQKINTNETESVPCSQSSQQNSDTTNSKKDDDLNLIDDIPQYMLQRIKLSTSIKSNDQSKKVPQFTESFTSAIKEMLKPDKVDGIRISTTKFVTLEPDKLPKCSVRVKRLESCESLKKYLSEDEGSKSVNEDVSKTQKKNSIEPNKNVLPDIPTPPASEDSRDSMISPPAKDDNRKKQEELESIEKISNKLLSKITFPNNEQEKESESTKKQSPTRFSLRQRRQSMAVSRNDEIYFNDNEDEFGRKLSPRKRRKSTYIPRIFNTKEQEEPVRPIAPLPKYKDAEVVKTPESTNNVDEPKVVENETSKPKSILKVRKDLMNSSTQSNETTKNEEKANDSQDVVEVLCSQEEIQTLESVKQLYPWIDDRIASKVVKFKKCIDVLMSEKCLFSTWKCMKQNCSFYTIDLKDFKAHAIKHEGDHHFCSFCLFDGADGKELADHLKDHDLDRYQCGKCMYRASEKIYVDWHRKKDHKDEIVKIYKSPKQILGINRRKKLEEEIRKENWKTFVLPYECSTPHCNKKFFSKMNYYSHLKKESELPSSAQYFGIIAGQIQSLDHKNELNKAEQKKGAYQCLYCEFGSDCKDEIQTHLSILHANKLGFICERSPETTNDKKETLETHTKIVYIAEDVTKKIKVKIFDESKKDVLKNELSTPDHLPSQNVKVQEDQNSNVITIEESPPEETSQVINLEETLADADKTSSSDQTSSSSTTQKSFPVIDKVIQIESY